MDYPQFLLLKLAEESAEIIQLCSKSSQFGLDSTGGGKESNKERLHKEITDFLAIVDMLNENGFDFRVNHEAILEKKEKVNKFLAISKDMGYVRSGE